MDAITPLRPRDAQREASRQRVLDAAHALFAEFGYSATTVRMIADRAGLSVGGVFTTFEDKADILHHVRMDQSMRLLEELRTLAPTLEGPTVDRVCAMVEVAYSRDFPNIPLVIAYIGAGYDWSLSTEKAMQEAHKSLFDAYRGIVANGVACGELRGELDVDAAVEMIHGIYQGNWRHAWYRRWPVDKLIAHTQAKLRMLFQGLEARGQPCASPTGGPAL